MKKLKLTIVCALGLWGITTTAQAQSWKDIFNSDNISKVVDTVNEVTGNTAVSSMTGTWTYSGSAVEFKSDNLLKKAGGAAAASTVETKLDEQLSRVGIKAGITQFTFNADSTFTSVVGTKKLNGTYSYDKSTSTVNLKYAKLVGINAKVSGSTNGISLLFDADKLLQLVTYIGSKANNSTIKAITTLAEGYDGMMLGLEMKK